MGNKASRRRKKALALAIFNTFDQKNGKVLLDRDLLDKDEYRLLRKAGRDRNGYISKRDFIAHYRSKPLHQLIRLYNRVGNKEQVLQIIAVLGAEEQGAGSGVSLADLKEFGMDKEWERRMRVRKKSSARRGSWATRRYSQEFGPGATFAPADAFAPISYLSLKKFFEYFTPKDVETYRDSMLRVRLRSVWALLDVSGAGEVSRDDIRERCGARFADEFVRRDHKSITFEDLVECVLSAVRAPVLGLLGDDGEKSLSLEEQSDGSVSVSRATPPPSAPTVGISPDGKSAPRLTPAKNAPSLSNLDVVAATPRAGSARVRTDRVKLLTDAYKSLHRTRGSSLSDHVTRKSVSLLNELKSLEAKMRILETESSAIDSTLWRHTVAHAKPRVLEFVDARVRAQTTPGV